MSDRIDYAKALNQMLEDLVVLKSQNERLIEALSFYADPDNFHVNDMVYEERDQEDFQILCDDDDSTQTDDFSKRARQTLADLGIKGGG